MTEHFKKWVRTKSGHLVRVDRVVDGRVEGEVWHKQGHLASLSLKNSLFAANFLSVRAAEQYDHDPREGWKSVAKPMFMATYECKPPLARHPELDDGEEFYVIKPDRTDQRLDRTKLHTLATLPPIVLLKVGTRLGEKRPDGTQLRWGKSWNRETQCWRDSEQVNPTGLDCVSALIVTELPKPKCEAAVDVTKNKRDEILRAIFG